MSYVEVHVWNEAGCDFSIDLTRTYGDGKYATGASPWPVLKKGNMMVVHAYPDPELQFAYVNYEPSGAIYKFQVTIDGDGVHWSADGPSYARLGVRTQRISDDFTRIFVGEAYHTHLQPKRVTAAQWSPDRFDVFAIGPGSQLLHTWVDHSITRAHPLKNGMEHRPGYHAWEPVMSALGGVRNVSACAWEPERIDLVAVHDRWGISHIWWNEAEFESEPLDFPATPGPEIAVVAMDVGHLEVIASDATNQLYRRTYRKHKWEPWSLLGRDIPAGVPISATRVNASELGIFVRYDDQLGFVEMRLDVTTGNQAWRNPIFQGPFTPSISAVTSWAPGRTDLFVTSPSNPKVIQHRWRDDADATWSEPEDIKFPYVTPTAIAACSCTPGHLELLALSSTEIVELPYSNGWQRSKDADEWTFIPHGFPPPW